MSPELPTPAPKGEKSEGFELLRTQASYHNRFFAQRMTDEGFVVRRRLRVHEIGSGIQHCPDYLNYTIADNQ